MRNILAIGLFIIACLFVVSCKEERGGNDAAPGELYDIRFFKRF